MVTPDSLDFDPVAVRARRDGWTPERQRQLVALLADGHSTAAALRIVGMTKQTLHALRKRSDAASFAAACDAALGQAARRRADRAAPSAYERAMHGYLVPFYRRGRLVRIEHRFDSMGLLRILKRLDKLAGAARPKDGGSAEAWRDQLPESDAFMSLGAGTRSIDHELGQFPKRMAVALPAIWPGLPSPRGPFRYERVADSLPDENGG